MIVFFACRRVRRFCWRSSAIEDLFSPVRAGPSEGGEKTRERVQHAEGAFSAALRLHVRAEALQHKSHTTLCLAQGTGEVPRLALTLPRRLGIAVFCQLSAILRV